MNGVIAYEVDGRGVADGIPLREAAGDQIVSSGP